MIALLMACSPEIVVLVEMQNKTEYPVHLWLKHEEIGPTNKVEAQGERREHLPSAESAGYVTWDYEHIEWRVSTTVYAGTDGEAWAEQGVLHLVGGCGDEDGVIGSLTYEWDGIGFVQTADDLECNDGL